MNTRFALVFILISLVGLGTASVPFAKSQSDPYPVTTIYADGSMDYIPSPPPIQRNGNVYTLTGNFSRSLAIERNNTIIDGAGYTILATHDLAGIIIRNCANITLKNLNLISNSEGIRLTSTINSTITDNNMSSNGVGIFLLNSNSIKISHNNITNNNGVGLDIENMARDVGNGQNLIVNNLFKENNLFAVRLSLSQNNTFYLNDFIDNKGWNLQVSNPWVYGPETNTWDNGSAGNYWSDYFSRYTNATEIDHTGTGDTSFFINPYNIDRYPLTEPYPIFNFSEPTLTSPSPTLSPPQSPSPLIPEFPSWILPLIVTASMVLIIFKRRIARK